MDEPRPVVGCLVALTGILRVDEPLCIRDIDIADLPRWQSWGWQLVAIDPEDERMADLFDTRKADERRWYKGKIR